MKVDSQSATFNDQVSERRSKNLDILEQILHDSSQDTQKSYKSSNEWRITDNGYSALPHKELNNQIGILQIAQRTLQNILSNSHITLDEVRREINNAQFLGSDVFSNSMILSSRNGEVLFDANRIINILPNDERDLYIFKKALKNEVDFIANSLQGLQNVNLGVNLYPEQPENVKDYLTSNAMLFSKAHNTAGLISRIDALLV